MTRFIMIAALILATPALAQQSPPLIPNSVSAECDRLGLTADQCANVHIMQLWEQEQQRANQLQAELEAQEARAVAQPVEEQTQVQRQQAPPPRQEVLAGTFERVFLTRPGRINGRTFEDYKREGYAYSVRNATHDIIRVRGAIIGASNQVFWVYFEQPPPHRLFVEKITISPTGEVIVTESGYRTFPIPQSSGDSSLCDSIFRPVNR
ncbi:MAG: hypothetical protein ABIH67_01550 [Candidatus Uhrbacteria bacterium]